MKKISLICILVFLSIVTGLFMSSCTADSEFQQKIAVVMEEKSGAELFNALLELDQQYPDKLELKLRLGIMLLDAGDLGKASSYLNRGKELVHTTNDDRLKTELYYFLGILSYIRGDARMALEHAEKALSISQDESLSYFLKARSLFMAGENEQAYELYHQHWPRDKELMTKEDLNFYFEGVVANDEYERAIEILDTYQLMYDYIIGQGVQASAFYEQLKNVNSALLAACMDLEYLRYLGAIDDAKLFNTLSELEVKIADMDHYPDKQSRQILEGIKSFFQNNWSEAERILADLEETHPFLQYMMLACEFETRGASQESLKTYVTVEPYFKGLPAYYYHFWRGMKNGQGEYTFQTAKAVIEKCILLANNTPFAAETRKELGRILGLTESQGQNILLGPELDIIFNSIVDGKEITLLDPVLTLISIPDNVYSMAAVLMLRQLQTRESRVRKYLEQKKSAAEGRLKERLVMVLEG